jgi:uncharacterized protein YcfL
MKKTLLILISILVIGCNSNKDNMTVSGNVDGLMKGNFISSSSKRFSFG